MTAGAMKAEALRRYAAEFGASRKAWGTLTTVLRVAAVGLCTQRIAEITICSGLYGTLITVPSS
jgi:hypothetical protein